VSPLQAELVELARADRHIAEAQERIAVQRAARQRAFDQGWPTDTADKLLATMEDSLVLMEAHRDQIRRHIAELQSERT
jgi:hypothetical protein